MKTVYIIGPKKRKSDYIGLWQLYPFWVFKRDLRRAGYKVVFKHAVSVSDIAAQADGLSKANIILFRPVWTEDPKNVLELSQNLRDKYPTAKILMVDPFDQSSSRFFESLPYLDLCVKYLSLSDKSLYLRSDYAGGVYGVEKLKTEYGVSPDDDWHVGSMVAPGQEHKIVSGFFCVHPALLRSIRSPIGRFLSQREAKELDIFCHMSCGERGKVEWYGKHRVAAVDEMLKIEGVKMSVAAEYSGEPRISRKEYLKRQRSAKIVYSPLGWGEITMRPFEAIANNNMLIQPDVGHIEVHPDILKPFETYVPVKWDLTDLKEKCEYYAHNEEERLRITNNAREAFRTEYTGANFVALFKKMAGEA